MKKAVSCCVLLHRAAGPSREGEYSGFSTKGERNVLACACVCARAFVCVFACNICIRHCSLVEVPYSERAIVKMLCMTPLFLVMMRLVGSNT